MIKKLLSLLLVSVMLFSLSAFAESEKPSVFVSDHTKNIISLSGAGADNQKVTLMVLNPGYTIEDLSYGTWQELTEKIAYSQSGRTSGGKYSFNIPLKDNAGIENGGGIFYIYITVGSGPHVLVNDFEFYYNAEKLNVIREINGVEEVSAELLEKAVKKFSFLNDPLYKEGNKGEINKAFMNIKNSFEDKKFPLDTNEFADYLEKALLVGGVNAEKETLLVSDGVLSKRLTSLLDEESAEDYLNSLSQGGRNSLTKDLFAKDYSLLKDLSDKFDELIALYVISDYKMNGYGHIEGFLKKYETRYKNADFDLESFSGVTNKNEFFSNYFDTSADTLRNLSVNFNNALSVYLNPAPQPTTAPSVGSGGGGGGGMPSPGKVTSGNEKSPVPTTVPTPPVSTKSFSDISENHWANSAVLALTEEKIISGYTDGTFKPDAPLSRAELTKLVVSLCDALEIELSKEKEVSFSDVSESDWFGEIIKTASSAGLISGSGESFMPNESISRQDTAVILYRLLADKFNFMPSMDFSDKSDIASYATEAVSFLTGGKIISGMGDGSFAPNEKLTRAQAAQLIYGVYSKLKGGIQQ